MSQPLRVLVAGGGIASLELILALRDLAEDRVEIELLSPTGTLKYHPLAVAEPFGIGEAHEFDLEMVARDASARLTLGTLAAVAPGPHLAVTGVGEELSYDALVVAVGARRLEGVIGAVTLNSRAAFANLRSTLDGLGRERTEDLVFAVPGGVAWPLPAYELALMTEAWLSLRTGREPISIAIVTPEEAPLAIFGREAADGVRALLEERGIALYCGSYPEAVGDGFLTLRPGTPIPADRVVALPRLAGPGIPGLPCDDDGFLPTDSYGRVGGLHGVYAAGDATTFPVKQGGLAAQQADAIARSIAAAAGAPVDAQPFDPVLRSLLLTGHEPSYLRAELASGRGQRSSELSFEAPWWPPSKIVGRHVSHYLARQAADKPPPVGAPFLRVETDDLQPYL